MPRRLNRQEQKALTQRRLLAAAQKVFLRRGYHDASLEEVAEEAGFTTGAVYSNFESKADLFLALFDQRVAERLEEIFTAAAGQETLEAKMRAIARQWTERFREKPEWNLLLIEFWASAARDRRLRRKFAARHEDFLQTVATLLEDSAAELGVELPVAGLDLARAGTAIGHGMALERFASPDDVPDELLEWMFGLLGREVALSSSDGATRELEPSPSRRTRR